MLVKLAVMAALGTTLFAQTYAEQLQKGIYAQDTAGDVEGAIAIYRKILGSGQAPRTVAATAQFRLTESLLKKGDLEAAGREFQILSGAYPEQGGFFKELQPKMIAATLARRAKFGLASDYAHYRHTQTGVELTAPFGTSFLSDYDSANNGQLAVFGGQMAVFGGHLYEVAVWLKPEPHQPSELAALARADIDIKASERREFEGWSLRPESIRTGGGADRQWVRAVAEYSEGSRGKMLELLTSYRTTKNAVFFFTRIPAGRLEELQGFFDRMVQAAVIP